ncbi:MAG: hypothetical protein QOF86_2168, partial [Baekduia sp.]|nr:hypothetical protein [Baekduia sp.]
DGYRRALDGPRVGEAGTRRVA